MEKFVILLGVCLLVGLLLVVLVGSVVNMWREARKKKKDMGRLKAEGWQCVAAEASPQ